MKKQRLIIPLVIKLSKIYFSNSTNKDKQYKKALFYTLKNMDGIYIKFLQVLAMSQNFMDGWSSPKEFEIFNQVTNENIILSKYIDRNAFSYIEETPFACGSFAQVYKAKTKDGEKVVIKVLRPTITHNLQNDLRKLKKIVKIIKHFLPKTFIDYKEAFDEFSNSCLLETDYKREVSNMKYFKKLYHNHPYVIIPKVYEELCTEKIIVQEFINGPTLADLISMTPFGESLEDLSLKQTGSDIWMQIMIAGGEALRTAMTADYVFGDPHPGNIILLPNDKIAFIDFGIIAQKPTSQESFYLWVKSYYEILMGKKDYKELLETSCMCFCPDILNAFKKCYADYDFFEIIIDALNQEIKKVNENNTIATSLTTEGHLFKVFTKFINNKNILNIKIDTHNFQLLKAMQMFLSSTTTIDNNYGNKKFSKIMIGAMHYALEYTKMNGVNHDSVANTKYNINECYEILIDTLSSLATDELLWNTIQERII